MTFVKGTITDQEETGFGSVFTDHMTIATFDDATGWRYAGVHPHAPLELQPAAAVLHYGQSVFEGMKAFRGVDGHVRLFRPRDYLQRLTRSAARMCMPAPDVEQATEWLLELLREDESWVPDAGQGALYVRPAIIATDPVLRVRPSSSFLFFVILSPVRDYYLGATALRIRVEHEYIRAAEGGSGAAKTGGNYAASQLATRSAVEEGFDQVLWLDSTRSYVQEMGTMNVMMRIGDSVVTPPIGDCILPGITRDTAIQLLRRWRVPVYERPISVAELVTTSREGRLLEVWGTGTAAGVVPVAEVKSMETIIRPRVTPGESLSAKLATAITDIQLARAADEFGWMVAV
jgi:branched-chain amino acid aminotransferase